MAFQSGETGRETEMRANVDRISVITVVFNDVGKIRKTIESAISQDWPDCEYIVIDGGSTDGTFEVIWEYSERISFYSSEPDSGVYDAMNKGLRHSTGDWVVFLNSGDTFFSEKTLSDVMAGSTDEADIIYGNSIAVFGNTRTLMEANADPSVLALRPAYRHGSSLVRGSIHRREYFDLSRRALGYALDFELINRLYKQGKIFQKVNVVIECFDREGMSNHPMRNIWYNYKITSGGLLDIRRKWGLVREMFLYAMARLRQSIATK